MPVLPAGASAPPDFVLDTGPVKLKKGTLIVLGRKVPQKYQEPFRVKGVIHPGLSAASDFLHEHLLAHLT